MTLITSRASCDAKNVKKRFHLQAHCNQPSVTPCYLLSFLPLCEEKLNVKNSDIVLFLFFCVFTIYCMLALYNTMNYVLAHYIIAHAARGWAKVCVLTEISLIFLSQTYTFNASSSLKKNCNKFMYWIRGQKISCTFMREPLQRFIFVWNNYERAIAKISFYMK